MVRFAGALPSLVGTRLMNRLDATCDRLRRQAKAAGTAEGWAAHAADAFVAAMDGEAVVRPGRAEVGVVDLGAWRRGHAHPGEAAHVVGGAPLPVGQIRHLASDAFVKAVVHDGVAISTVAHLGRHIPAELRTALDLGPLPALDGVECAEAGCGRRQGLEWDHVDPVANGGATSAANLVPRCWPYHRDKTERDRRAGLLGPANRFVYSAQPVPLRANCAE